MTIPTYMPAITVTLFKNIDRQQGTAQRYQGAQRTIDLTPYMADSTSIDTNKDIYNPAGQWRITFADQPDPTINDTVYSLIEPMDVIEIRGSRNAYQFAGTKLPLIMRGFVGSVRRPESMSADITARTPFDFNHPNNEPGLYGSRKMEWPTELLPSTLSDYPLKQAPAQQNQSAVDIVSWHVERGAFLQAMNQDNVVLEDGVIRARGNEIFRPGRYLELTRNKVKSEFYLTRVSHSIVPLTSWESTLIVERGTGFLARNKMQGSPYWAEGRPGVYGPPVGAASAAA